MHASAEASDRSPERPVRLLLAAAAADSAQVTPSRASGGRSRPRKLLCPPTWCSAFRDVHLKQQSIVSPKQRLGWWSSLLERPYHATGRRREIFGRLARADHCNTHTAVSLQGSSEAIRLKKENWAGERNRKRGSGVSSRRCQESLSAARIGDARTPGVRRRPPSSGVHSRLSAARPAAIRQQAGQTAIRPRWSV
ncbi:hypothetical protein MTO96_008503 [Rhipicephalus appendiculatus]